MPPPRYEARRWLLTGRVQGVGFRPFIFRLATLHGLSGWVRNLAGRVEILAQGEVPALDAFAAALVREAPPLARPLIEQCAPQPPQTLTGFAIEDSRAHDRAQVHIPPDGAPCADCERELADPNDRRHAYPFINCTQCGPRYTLIARLPYDRAHTSMAGFALCPDCRREYENPRDRRFHAEPLACPACGPRLQFHAQERGVVEEPRAALAAAVAALRQGAIVALKGIGGYHLLVDARDDRAIARLRRVKPRPHKPLAVMFPLAGADGLDAVRAAAECDAQSGALLLEPARPIVLLRKRTPFPLSAEIAPGLAEVGALLPYSPLHRLLLREFGAPLVATSGNVSGEPVLTDNAEAEQRLAPVADAFLHHDRPILRPADDPVYRPIAGRLRPLRLGRGVAPLELELPRALPQPLLAVGGHIKSCVALAWERRVVVSPHIGDLGTPRSRAVFAQVIDDLQRLYAVRAARVACDAHPDYASTRWARACGLPAEAVFHHRAHAAALAGEYPQVERWLVFTWDGTGYGEDGTLWGGEALLGNAGAWQRVASFRPFHLPGGEKAGREPWRSALALCWETGRDWPDGPPGTALLHAAWQRHLNAPPTSAVGRLFDAAAAFTGVNRVSSFEGQGPMLLEALIEHDAEPLPLPLAADAQGLWRSDWAPLVPMLLDAQRPVAERAAIFHASLAQALVDQAGAVRAQHGEVMVGLSGGVFQNRVLAEAVQRRLVQAGFAVYLGEKLPANDAALAYGQVIEVGSRSGQG
jgi:hydrogenase maturation protein HypF